jgi:hypothetical protein
VRLYKERLCIGPPLYPSNDMMFVAPLLIGLPQQLSDLHRNSFNAFSVILGLNCSVPGPVTRAILSTEPCKHPSMGRQFAADIDL